MPGRPTLALRLGEIAISPSNPDVLYVAYTARTNLPPEESGVLRSADGGKLRQEGGQGRPDSEGEWHSIKVAVQGTVPAGCLDGEHILDDTLAAPVSGKVGLWAKTDSVTEFSDFVVTPAPAPQP